MIWKHSTHHQEQSAQPMMGLCLPYLLRNIVAGSTGLVAPVRSSCESLCAALMGLSMDGLNKEMNRPYSA
jgi:hypothetical protein